MSTKKWVTGKNLILHKALDGDVFQNKMNTIYLYSAQINIIILRHFTCMFKYQLGLDDILKQKNIHNIGQYE